jgi:hypothetical protein
MYTQVLYTILYQVSVFGIVACAVAYVYALLNPNIERHFRRLAQGVTSAVGIILILALLTVLAS